MFILMYKLVFLHEYGFEFVCLQRNSSWGYVGMDRLSYTNTKQNVVFGANFHKNSIVYIYEALPTNCRGLRSMDFNIDRLTID